MINRQLLLELFNFRIGHAQVHYLVAGIFNVQCGLLLERLHHAGLRLADVAASTQQFTYPARLRGGQSGSQVLARRDSKTCPLGDDLKCTASEGLSLYPVLRLILMMQVFTCKATQDAVRCFFALCEVLDMLVQAAVVNPLLKKGSKLDFGGVCCSQ